MFFMGETPMIRIDDVSIGALVRFKYIESTITDVCRIMAVSVGIVVSTSNNSTFWIASGGKIVESFWIEEIVKSV